MIAGAALAPDLDLLGRFLDGVNHHQRASHSVGAAMLAALAVWAVSSPRLGATAGLGWLSHVALDWLGSDTHPPIGLMALWPFDSGFYKSPYFIFLDVGRSMTWDTVWHNAIAVTWECVLLLPIFFIIERARSGAR